MQLDAEHDEHDLSISKNRYEEHGTFSSRTEVVNAIIIPSYKEDIDVLEDTLKVLSSHRMAVKTYDVSIIPLLRVKSWFKVW